MNLSNKQLNTTEQNHLGHFAYLLKNLGFDVYEMNSVTVINCDLKTSMFSIVYGAPKDTTSLTLSASSDSGYHIYERLGFSKAGKFECFEYKGDRL